MACCYIRRDIKISFIHSFIHPRKSGTPTQVFLGKLALHQEIYCGSILGTSHMPDIMHPLPIFHASLPHHYPKFQVDQVNYCIYCVSAPCLYRESTDSLVGKHIEFGKLPIYIYTTVVT